MINKFTFLSIFFALGVVLQMNAQGGCTPIAICPNQLNVSLDAQGEALLWAEDFYAGMVPDTCNWTLEVELLDTGTQDVIIPRGPSLTVNCSHAGQIFLFDLEISDGSNTNNCWGYLIVQDKIGGCIQIGFDTIAIFHNIIDEDFASVSAFLNDKKLNNYTNNSLVFSNIYVIHKDSIPDGENVIHFDSKREDIINNLNELSTLDYVHGEKMMLGIDGYTPLRALLFDNDGSGSMSVGDFTELRGMIIGRYDSLSNSVYEVLHQDHTFSSGFDQFDFGIDYNRFYFNKDTIDSIDFVFNAFRRGDIDRIPDSLMSGNTQSRSNSKLEVIVDHSDSDGSDALRFTILDTESNQIHGFLISIDVSDWPDWELNSSESIANFDYYEKNGELRIFYADAIPVDEVTFDLILSGNKYLGNEDVINLIQMAEGVNYNLEESEMEIRLLKRNVGQIKISPNPSIGILNISGISEHKNLELIDLNGRVVFTEEVKSIESIELDLHQLGLQSGTYILHLMGESENDIRKIQFLR